VTSPPGVSTLTLLCGEAVLGSPSVNFRLMGEVLESTAGLFAEPCPCPDGRGLAGLDCVKTFLVG
jgi:hypothetical protein